MSKSYSGTLQVVVFLAHSLTIDLSPLPTLIAILCPERLILFEHRPFYDLLPSMFVRTMRGAGRGVTTSISPVFLAGHTMVCPEELSTSCWAE